MKILHLESAGAGEGGQGDHVYRTSQPCRALGMLDDVEVVSGSLLSPSALALAAAADVLVLCDVVDVDLLPVVTHRRRAGRLTVYEINDHFLAPQPWNPIAYLAENLLTRSLSSLLARSSDGLQFTVPELSRTFAHLAPEERRAVFPNQLWDVPAPRSVREAGEVRVGWGGSLGHLEDLRWVMPALQAVVQQQPQVQLSIMGPEDFRPLFDWVPAGRFRFTPGGPLARYYEFLRTIDVGVCPLLPTAFNRCRSDVKFLELAAYGAVAVCADLPPYQDSVRHGDNGFVFRTREELVQVVGALVTDAGLRADVARRAHDQVTRDRREQPHASDRIRTYQAWGASPVDAPSWNPGSTRRPHADARYRMLGGDELERLLHRGLALARDGHAAQAAKTYGDAARRAPTFHLPWLLRGSTEPRADQALQALDRAAALAPGSPSVAFVRADRLEQAGRLDDARRELQRCLELAPTLGAAQSRLGAIAEQAGDVAGACLLYEASFAANPFFAPPALRRATLAFERGDDARAVQILERAIEHDTDLWTLPYLLGRIHVERGRFAQARPHLERALERSHEPGPVLALLAKAYVGVGAIDLARGVLAAMKSVSRG